MIRVGLIGAEGEMGRRVVMEVAESKKFRLSAAITDPKSPNIGRDIGEMLSLPSTGTLLSIDIAVSILEVDVIIDFSSPESTVEHLMAIQNFSVPIVIGTRGFSAEQLAVVHASSHIMPVMLADNSSMGINLVLNFLTHASRIFDKTTDISIQERRGMAEPEFPSAIALKMAKIVVEEKDLNNRDSVDETALVDRLTHHNKGDRLTYMSESEPSEHDSHTVTFISDEEEITITHNMKDEIVFARGALYCAEWLLDQRPGLYETRHLFNYPEL